MLNLIVLSNVPTRTSDHIMNHKKNKDLEAKNELNLQIT